MASCQGCGATVFWKRNVKTGKAAPVDPEPSLTGNVVMEANGYRVLNKAELNPPVTLFDAGEPERLRYTLHFATCPNADHFRRCGTCHKEPCVCRPT
jgi:hypothetical protein